MLDLKTYNGLRIVFHFEAAKGPKHVSSNDRPSSFITSFTGAPVKIPFRVDCLPMDRFIFSNDSLKAVRRRSLIIGNGNMKNEKLQAIGKGEL
ncbi:hypothetical protein TNIN_332171 [Trichonephila inaurata madagascariensis]|uniref:Uncharacterized protein n=1 Tax=Trichonephila inaurata madagascariensis TaxID=2747483 RepID=A0A8X7C222_9ARAC|nr:hypothetical protein TNIN_332171 [Trichonephila inaurata madagascariensis]